MKTVQITLDEPLAEEVDRAVEKLGTTRSGFTRDALREALLRIDEKEQDRPNSSTYTALFSSKEQMKAAPERAHHPASSIRIESPGIADHHETANPPRSTNLLWL
jgi:metal-responsive CopG/Arc/MetJ family transcriptional regulator